MAEHPDPLVPELSSRAGTSDPPEPAEGEMAALREELLICRQVVEEQRRQIKRFDEDLQHRARNTLALVRSAFKRTLDTGKSLEDVEMHFCGRLDVLAHYMLPRSSKWEATIDVETMVRNELRSFEFGDAPGITLKGQDAELSLEQAQPFALAIHELVTNALKYGALSGQKDGALSVTWAVRNRRLALVWTETGVPLVALAPAHSGFGQEYIEEALPYQLGATTRFERRPGGITCTIELPLAPLPVAEQFVNDRET